MVTESSHSCTHAVEWSPRSPDLTPCDYFLWGHLKNKVFATPPHDLEELQGRIREEVDALRNDPAMLRRAVQEMLRRCDLFNLLEGVVDMLKVWERKRAMLMHMYAELRYPFVLSWQT